MGMLFISHSSKNNDAAVKLRDWLNEQGWREVFLDLDPSRGLAPGQRWQEELKKAGERCLAVVVLVSPGWAASRWCQTEYLVADQLGKKIFPVLITPTPFEDLPLELKSKFQLADISTPEREAEGLARLAVGLKRAGLDPNSFTWPPPGEPSRRIYRGLQSLEEQDAAIFFGRDTTITKGLDALRRMRAGAPERILVILGASGSGKSSFLKAGLIARLKRDEENFVVLPIVRPERAALTGTQGLLASLGRDVKTAKDARAVLAQRRAEIVDHFKRFADAGQENYAAKPPTIVIPIDQCEEFFATDNNEAARALDLLAETIQLDGDALVVATIRSDSFERLQTEQRLAAVARLPFDLPPLPPSGFKDVIEGPARLAQPPLAIEPALTEQLLKDLDAADALPLLAFTLQRLVATQGTDGKISLVDYVDGLHGLQGAISGAVESAFSAAVADPSLPRERTALEKLAREVFIPALVQLDDVAAQPKRRVERFDVLPEAVRPLVRHFVHQRLLVTDRRMVQGAERDVVEVAHEAILRQWQLLGSWIAEERDALCTVDSLRRAAAEWRNSESGLLHRGDRLADAERIALRPDFGAALAPNERAYLRACRDSENARRAAEAEQIEKEKRSLARQRRFQRRALWATAAAVVVTGVGGWAVVAGQRNLARSQSLMLSRVADQFYAQNDFTHGMHLAILAAKDTFLSPAAPEAVDSLASNAAAAVLELELRGHANPNGAAFSKDGSRILTWGEDGTARLWDTATGTPIDPSLKHEGPVNSAVFSQDESRILTSSDDMTARLWNAKTGQPIDPPLKHAGLVKGAVFSHDESRILTWSNDGTARLWNAKTGELIGQLKLGATLTRALFSQHDTRILTWGLGERTTRLWNGVTAEPIGGPLDHEGPLNGAIFSKKDEGVILTWDREGTTRLSNAETGQRGKPMKHARLVNGAALSEDERRILTWSADGTARLWDVETATEAVKPLMHGGDVSSAVFSRDGRRILTAGDGTVKFWSAETGEDLGGSLEIDGVKDAVFSQDESWILTRGDTFAQWRSTQTSVQMAPPVEHSVIVGGAVFPQIIGGAVLSPDEKHILTWGRDGTARLWSTGPQRGLPLKHAGDVLGATFFHNGSRILTWSVDSTVRLWNAETGVQIGQLKHDGPIRGAVFPRNDESRILTWSDDTTARLWNTTSGTQIQSFRHPADVHGAVLSKDGRRLLSWSGKTAFLWDAATGTQIGELEHAKTVWGAVFSPDESLVLTWGDEHKVRIWGAASRMQIRQPIEISEDGAVFSADGTLILTWTRRSAELLDATTGKPIFEHDEDDVAGAAFSHDESRILVWNDKDDVAKLWDTKTGMEIGKPLKHPGDIKGALFTKDDRRILTWDSNGTWRLWHPSTGEQIGQSLQYDGDVRGAVFSRDERRVLTWGSFPWTARVWDVATGAQIGPPFRHALPINGAAFLQDETRILTWSEDGTARQFDVSWTVPPASNASLVRETCAKKLKDASISLLDAADIQAAPILRGREGEGVCTSRTFFDWLSDISRSLK